MDKTINLKLSESRTEWIDIARAIAILLVMIEHLNFPVIRPYITVFFMPVFFFLSGITFRADVPLRKFIKKKFFGLIIPYFFFSVITLLAFVGYAFLFDSQALNWKLLVGLIYGRGSFFKNPTEADMLMRGNQQMWFLLALFIMELLMYIVVSLHMKSNKQHYICVYLMLTIGCLYNIFCGLLLPWSIDNALICLIFMFLGYIVRDKLMQGIKCARITLLLFTIVGFLVTVVCGHFCGLVDICFGDYGRSYFLFFIGGFSGSIMICGLSVLLSDLCHCRLLRKFGENTLPIYALHLTVYEITDVMAHIFNASNVVNQNIIEIAKLILAIAVLVPIIVIMNRYFPILVGKRKK